MMIMMKIYVYSIKWEGVETQNVHSNTSQQDPLKKNNLSKKHVNTTSKEPANTMSHVTSTTIRAQKGNPKNILPADTLKKDFAYGKTNANFCTWTKSNLPEK